MKILFAASEASPFVKTGGLADVAGSLPNALSKAGEDVCVILPLYSAIDTKWRNQMSFCFYTFINLSWRREYCGVFRLDYDSVTYYFLDNENYFKRDGIYGFMDDGERFGFFSRAIVELIPLLNFTPDVIHCNDWQTALVPIYLSYESSVALKNIKSVFTIHNIEYQGRFSPDTAQDVFGLPEDLYESGMMRYDNDIDLMKGAIYKADYITTVSPSYADELSKPEHAHGLHIAVKDNSYKFRGILNGIDTGRYNPQTDPYIEENYSADNIEGKSLCKVSLCRELGLSETSNEPIISCISRLVGHKGFDLITEALDRIVEKGTRLVILGTGESQFESFFRDAENRYKGRVSSNIMYSESRAMRIYSGADILLMPSRSEPCGLAQMIAMRYGTIPIVREVGGLKDTVHSLGTEGENGFSFFEYSPDCLSNTIDHALQTFYREPNTWEELMFTGMTAKLNWDVSAEKYIEIYKNISS